jgi:hypothetical protein
MKIFGFCFILLIALSQNTSSNPNSRSFLWNNSAVNIGNFNKHTLSTCNLTLIGNIAFTPGGSSFAGSTLYTVNSVSPFQLFRVDTATGAHVLVANVSGVPGGRNITGLSWDITSGVMYAMVTNCLSSQLATINLTNGAMTLIGSPSIEASCVATLASSPTGVLFALDVVTDNLYRFNKTTGVATLIGPMGISVDTQTEMQFDISDSLLYVIVANQLRQTTAIGGAGTLICTFSGAPVTAFAIKCCTTLPVTYCRNGLNIPIPDLGTARDSVFITLGAGSMVLDVNTVIDTVVHTFDADMVFYLRRTVGNVGVKIINRVGGGGDNFIGTILDDEGTLPVPQGVPPFTGVFQPSNPLFPFDGPFDSGWWRLQIVDTVGGDSGFLRAWCLQITYSVISGGVHTVEIPNHYLLNQNYPNPFNPSTKIKFGIPKSANVKLTVYDVLGREVRVLVNQFKHPNTYEVDFDGSALPSGVYFYKLVTDDFTSTKKMLMLK